MNMNQFFRDLTSTVAGGAERRFARDLARTLGFRIHEPEHGKPTPTTSTAPAPAPTQAAPYSASFEASVEHGRTWGFNRAYRTDLQRLVEWVDTVRGEITASDVAAVVFPKPIGEWMRRDADR